MSKCSNCFVVLVSWLIFACGEVDVGQLAGCSPSAADDCEDNVTMTTEAGILNQTDRQASLFRQEPTTSSSLRQTRGARDKRKNSIFFQLTWDRYSYRIREGTSLNLSCFAQRKPKVLRYSEYKWLHNYIRIQDSPRRRVVGDRLHIKDVRPSDSGVYRCYFYTRDKRSTKKDDVRPLVAGWHAVVIIRSAGVDVDVYVGANITLSCNSMMLARHFTDVKYMWFHDFMTFRYTERVKENEDNTLRLSYVNVEASGLWQCAATTPATGTSWMTNEMRVLVRKRDPGWEVIFESVLDELLGQVLAVPTVLTAVFLILAFIAFEIKKHRMLHRLARYQYVVDDH